MQDADARYLVPPLDLADESLADASPLRHLSLRETSNRAGRDKFVRNSGGNVSGTRPEPEPGRGHDHHRGGRRSARRYVSVTARLLGCAT